MTRTRALLARLVHARHGLSRAGPLAADARYAVRRSRRAPLATITIVLVLSLGIGSNVGFFTLLNSLATLPAPGMAPDKALVRIRGTVQVGQAEALQPRLLSWPEVQEYAGRTDLFSSVAAHADETGLVTGADPSSQPVTTRLIYTTANYFGVLNVHPVLGTPPVAEPDVRQLATSPTAMISHAFWQQTFGGSPDVIGRVVGVNGTAVMIVGVAPPRFTGTVSGSAVTMWVPLAAYPLLQQRTSAVFASTDSLFLHGAARLLPGVRTEAATAIVAGIARRMSDPVGEAPARAAHLGSADVVPMLASNERVGSRADQLVSGAAAGALALVVLLITCTNVSALLIGLAVARRREIAVRLSLGAPRARLVRQLLTESVLLALAAATLGLLVTAAGIGLAGRALPDVPLAVDWRVTIASFSVAVVAGVLCGLSPALHATRVPVNEALRGASSAIAAPPPRAQRALVIAQIALTQPLLVGLGVVVATMTADLRRQAPSGVADQLVEVELDTWAGRVSAEEREGHIVRLVEGVAGVPGVRLALPMQMGTVAAPVAVHPADRIDGAASVMQANLTAAPKGYFEAFAIPIVRGRDFDPVEYVHSSRDGEPPSFEVAIIGSDLAHRLWGNADPLGRRLVMALPERAGSQGMVVVGVVDAAVAGPSEVNGQVRLYVPYAVMNTGVLARTAGPALPLVNDIRRAVTALAPQIPVYRIETVAQREAEFRGKVLRAGGAVAGGGLLALLLSAIGLYAVVSFSVGQRTREIGIRTALGAHQGRIVLMFFGRGLALGVVGLLLGLPLSIVATRFIASTLNWPLAMSPVPGIGVGTAVLLVTAAAVWMPARRASRVDPVTSLQGD